MDTDDIQTEPITSETLHELIVQIKSLAARIGEFEGDEFRSALSHVLDAADSLRSAFRKAENNKKVKKRDNRQTSMLPFMKK